MRAMCVSQKARIAQAYEAGEKVEVIALLFGVHRSSVHRLARACGWPARRKGQRPRWVGKELESLQQAWLGSETREQIARRMCTSEARIFLLARQHGWPARKSGRRAHA